ncbi:MAG: glycosyltransferase family 2 protein [Deltaproteobacteria bacterium]|nr:glycosyltransferase family 2 protein [Deltaproteobacteria bacterium]
MSPESPQLSIVTVNWNVKDLLLRMISSVPRAAAHLSFEVIVVDNASADGSAEAVRALHPEVLVIRSPENLGFSRGNNLGFLRSKGELVAFVNPDVELLPGSLERLASFLRARPLAGMVGPKITRPDGAVQSEPGTLPGLRTVLSVLPGAFRLEQALFRKIPPSTPVRCGYLHGSCFMFRRRAYEAIGLMPTLTFMYGEEILIGRRLKDAGFDVWYVPDVEVRHDDDASADKRWTPPEKEIVRRKAYTEIMREVLSPNEFRAWNAIMLARSASSFVRSPLGKGPERAFVEIHARSARRSASK